MDFSELGLISVTFVWMYIWFLLMILGVGYYLFIDWLIGDLCRKIYMEGKILILYFTPK